MKHCMLDLETWGTAPGSALRSVGAVMFELDGSIGQRYYANISSEEQRGKLVFDSNTEDWWEKQGDEAKRLLEENQRSIQEVLREFYEGFKAAGGVYLWGNGANFDPVLWEAACRAFDQKIPWQFWNVRCCRTWCAAHDFNPKTVPFVGVKHYALDDCLHQIKYVCAAIKPAVVVSRETPPEIPSNTFRMPS